MAPSRGCISLLFITLGAQQLADSHYLLAMDSYWETLELNELRKRLIDYILKAPRKLTTRSELYAVPIANSPTIMVEPNALSLSR